MLTTILDVGSGTGQYKSLINRTNSEYNSIDIDKSSNADIIVDAHLLPFKDRFFHAVICTQVIEQIHSPHEVINGIARVLRPNAKY